MRQLLKKLYIEMFIKNKSLESVSLISKYKAQTPILEISKEDIQALDKLCFIGIGGGGTNIIEDISNLDNKHIFIHINSDLQSLNQKKSKDKILLGCRGKERYGENFINEDVKNRLYELTKKVEFIYIISTLGGSVGSGATPEILEYLKSINKTVTVFVTTPFYFENKIRIATAYDTIDKIKLYTDNLIILKNDDILDMSQNNFLGVKESFKVVSNIIFKTIINWNKMS